MGNLSFLLENKKKFRLEVGKLGKIWIFFQIPNTRKTFSFEKKRVSDLAQNSLRINVNKFDKFWNVTFFEKVKKIQFQLWNLAKFQTWNRFFFKFFKTSLEHSKIWQIYVFWKSSEQILSKFRETFFTRFLKGISL